jgi:hypothetical protein
MGKRKKPAVEAFDKHGPQNLPAGYTWCPECQASFQGDLCPGCVDLSGAGARPDPPQGITAETRDAIVDMVAAKGLDFDEFFADKIPPGISLDELTEEFGSALLNKLREVPDPGTETGPTTLGEVAEQASIETTTIVEILPVPLTDAEHKEISQRMAAANQEIAQIEIDLKAVKSQFKSRKESAEARRNECSDFINAGHQQKQVECILVKDFTENTITLIRQDTGEIVRTRTMLAAERQRGLDFGKED